MKHETHQHEATATAPADHIDEIEEFVVEEFVVEEVSIDGMCGVY